MVVPDALGELGRIKPRIDLRELPRGRYVPVTSVSILKATVDRGAWEQLACFRHLERLTFQDCRVEPATEFRVTSLCCLKHLELWGTPITIDNVRTVSRLRHLRASLSTEPT